MKFERFVFCQYCDDVRYEIDGKISLIGVYPGGLQVNSELPTTIAKLWVVCHVGTPKENPFKELKLEIAYNGSTLLSADTPAEALSESSVKLSSPDGRGYMLTLALPLPPLEIKSEGAIEVFLRSEADSFPANKLEIRVASAHPREVHAFGTEA